MAVVPKAIYRFNATSIKIPWQFSQNQNKYPKIYMESQKKQNCQSNTEEKEQSWKCNSSTLRTVLQTCSNQNCGIGTKTELWINATR